MGSDAAMPWASGRHRPREEDDAMNDQRHAVRARTLKESAAGDLLGQYGCGPIRFAGTDDALYERHLMFDNVMAPEAVGAPH